MDAWNELPRYDPTQTYGWNFRHVPGPVELEIPAMPGDWTFAGARTASPLGIPAGPLLNGAWCLYYASLGFDVLTYKTVRSSARDCYPPPNVQPVKCSPLKGGEEGVPTLRTMAGSWAVSYGMPSRGPEFWRADVTRTRALLRDGQQLVVSVVGSIQEGWSLDDLADDYAQCGEWARDAGADAVEMNFSCPNVDTCDGQLYQFPKSAGSVAARVRARLGSIPLIVKIGHLPDGQPVEPLLEALGPHVDMVSATNSIAATVRGADGVLLFSGQPRGICGAAIRDASVAQIERLRGAIDRLGLPTRLIGVGGVATVADVKRYLSSGAESVQLATSAMVRPWSALQIRRDWTSA